jgi:hypothetical protein
MVQELIGKYDCGSDKGIGLVFVMENFDKMFKENTASMIVVFFLISGLKKFYIRKE